MLRLELPVLATVDTLAGRFTFCDASGQPDTAEFFVRCEPHPNPSNPDFTEIMDRRSDAVNSQLTDAWSKLQSLSCSAIHYVEVHPDPFV